MVNQLRVFLQFPNPIVHIANILIRELGLQTKTCKDGSCRQFLNQLLMLHGIVLIMADTPGSVEAFLTTSSGNDGSSEVMGIVRIGLIGFYRCQMNGVISSIIVRMLNSRSRLDGDKALRQLGNNPFYLLIGSLLLL